MHTCISDNSQFANTKISNSKKYYHGGVIAFNVLFGKIFGSATAALFLSQAIYWSDKGQGLETQDDGWFYKTREQWQDETSLSFDEQFTARKKLKDAGVLEEFNKKLEHRMYYRVDFEQLDIVIDSYFRKTGEAVLRGSQKEAPKVRKPYDADICSHLPETGKALVGKPEKPSSYLHKTTYIDINNNKGEEDNLDFYFKEINPIELNVSIPEPLKQDHKFSLEALERIRERSSISDKDLLSMVKKFIIYYRKQENCDKINSLYEWEDLLVNVWVNNWHSFNKIPLKAELSSKLVISKDIIKENIDPSMKEILYKIKNEVGDGNFLSWFRDFELKEKQLDSWKFVVNKNITREWLYRNFLDIILRAVKTVDENINKVDIVVV